MNMLRAKEEIQDAIQKQMSLYWMVRGWQDAARRDVMGDPSQYEPRKRQLERKVDCLERSKKALAEAIEIEEMETATNGQNSRGEGTS